MNLRAVSLRLCLCVSALCGPAACTTVQDHGRYAVTSQKAPFYKYGPAQAFGADFALTRGQYVTMVERGFGFSRVLTEDGQSGYISTDDLAAKPEPVAVAVPPRLAGRGVSGGANSRRKTANIRPEPDGALFNFNDVPLPSHEPELPRKDELQPPKPEPRTAPASSDPKIPPLPAEPVAKPDSTPKPAAKAAHQKKRAP